MNADGSDDTAVKCSRVQAKMIDAIKAVGDMNRAIVAMNVGWYLAAHGKALDKVTEAVELLDQTKGELIARIDKDGKRMSFSRFFDTADEDE